MVDFLKISTRSKKKGTIEIYPKFIITTSNDLMIRGGDFYAIWLEELGLWSTSEQDALRLIDRELDKFAEENKDKYSDEFVKILHMWDAESGMIDAWHKYCQKQMRDSFHMLDEKLIFQNTDVKKRDYASKRLDYPIEEGEPKAWKELMNVLYSPEELKKIEWAIGSVVSGDSKKIQKFLVLYGAAGTGKSTVLNVIQDLFEGYYSVFDAKALGSSNNSFALEAFKNNPLVAIQHDGDLSRIEDNTRLNSLVSHELMTVNEKFKSTYSNRFKAFLFMGTNKPVKITDAKSGLLRRLIDVSPTGQKVPLKDYRALMNQIKFELGKIANYCLNTYLENPSLYDEYIPTNMLGASNDFYNFVLDSYYIFKQENGVTLKQAWEMYKTYCQEANVLYPFSQRVFKEELKNYFEDYYERFNTEDGQRVRSYYYIFKTDQFNKKDLPKEVSIEEYLGDFMDFKPQSSILDSVAREYPAQYANKKETPQYKWDDVTTALKDLDTSELHYVKLPENHIVIDFDIPDNKGNKSLKMNKKEASKWPATYAELSKSGQGIHLHYIYTGDVERLQRLYDEHIEIKVFTGKSSLRRKLSECNSLPIAKISSGLPLKGDKKMVNFETVKTERGLRKLIKENLNKEIHANTKPSIDFIYKILEDAYNNGLEYDVSDMRNAISAFAATSTNQADYCIKLVQKMKFCSDNVSEPIKSDNGRIIFFDIEVFPNLLLVCWKLRGAGKPTQIMINPSPKEIEELLNFRLVGFNNRRYDNHILYAALLGYTNEQIYNVSHKIINNSPNAYFREAYNISYTDIYDFSSDKKSLKKFEIELGLHHQEFSFPFDEPLEEKYWDLAAEYCCNDVAATEAVFEARQADFLAREILADLAGMTVNDTTNSLTTRIIFGENRKPQDQFNYRNLGDLSEVDEKGVIFDDFDDEYTIFNRYGQPCFKGYTFDHGISIYRGEEVGEGGYVYSEPGMYTNVALLDVESMHPTSAINEKLFGEEYTKRFDELKQARLAIKHGDFKKAKTMLGGKLALYLDDETKAKDLSFALKIAINSVYGLTAATFENPFRDIRNIDNIVAKRGALFMINLKHYVQSQGFQVCHIKTDSIKIPNATQDIIAKVMKYGKAYGYNFEHEATYERMCLVNDAVYIARYPDGKWTATGTQFQVPYVFKTLFSKEPIEFRDLCETKSVSTALYLDFKGDQQDPHFVGRVGQFCPMTKDGGDLLRLGKDKDGNPKYSAATGSKNYKWMESESVKALGKEKDIDKLYYERLCEEAIKTISEYGDFEWFVSDEEVPPWDVTK